MTEFKISDLLVKQLSESFSCIVCTDLLSESHDKIQVNQCPHGHCLCSDCWTKQIENKKKECPICRAKVKLEFLSRNLFLESEFKKKKVYCKYQYKEEREDGKIIKDEENGCKDIIRIEEMETHFKNCRYAFINCPNGDDCKINSRFRKNQLEEHNKFCEYLKVPCQYCKTPIAKINKDHLESECQSYKIKCTHCKLEMLRMELPDHLQVCPEMTIQCKYKEGGCEVSFQRKHQANHLASENNHIGFIQNIIDQHRILLDESDRCFKRLKSSHETLEKRLTNINKYSNQWVIENWMQKVIDIPNDEVTSTKRVSCPMFYFNSRKYNVSCFPNGFTPANKDYISLYLHLHEASPNINIKFSFEIVNSDPTKSIKKEKNSYFQNDKGIGWEKFTECKTINTLGEGFVVGNKLTIKFEIEIPQTTDPLTTK
ncbi:hypothetical protein ACTFIZ_000698 [Dictyostelium cf. discoideum]